VKIGMATDSLGHLSLADLLDTVAGLASQVSGSTPPTGPARRAFLAKVQQRDLAIIALNANGNPLHPTKGESRWRDVCYRLRMVG
jgi:sugar phosphate isomerase/epimerase